MKENLNIIPPADNAKDSVLTKRMELSYMERLKLHVNETGTNPKELRKEFLKSFFSDLHRTSHHIYALWECLPVRYFAVIRYWDHKAAGRKGLSYRETPDVYSPGEFNASIEKFHEYDEFRVMFDTALFYFESELTPEMIEQCYARFLQVKCEKAIRANAPFRLTPELIRRYGLMQKDVEIICSYLDKYNNAAIEKIKAEYEALKKLDCTL